MPISMFLKANVQRLWFYQKLQKLNSLSIPSGVASLSMPCGCSTTHYGDIRTLCVEVRHTSGVWLEYESILRKLQRVSEVATNHWVFLRCDWSLDFIWFYYQSEVKKNVIFPNLIWMGKKYWFLSSEVWLRVEKVLGTPQGLFVDSHLFW